MDFSYEELMNFIDEEDVKFIRLAFSDINGKQKNISIMPGELERAFRDGISFDASAVPGFAKEIKSDLFLFPDSSTLSILPWRPTHGEWCECFAILNILMIDRLSRTAATY